jgi:hypothetical protein
LENTLKGLEDDGVIEVIRDGQGNVQQVGISDAEREAGRENYDFYCFLIWPFIEASWLGAVSLMGLTPVIGHPGEAWIDVSKAQNSAQLVSLPNLTHWRAQLTRPSSAKPSTTKATSPTSKPSTKKRSKTRTSASTKKA